MTRARVLTFLDGVIGTPGSPVVEAFCRLMRPRQYGREETIDAWSLFLEGWSASEDRKDVGRVEGQVEVIQTSGGPKNMLLVDLPGTWKNKQKVKIVVQKIQEKGTP